MLDRNFAPLVPSLNRCMVRVPEHSSHRPDTPQLVDNAAVVFHDHVVRSQRTTVKVDVVPDFMPRLDMVKSAGTELSALRSRAKMTLDDVASALGLRGRSSVQRLFAADLDNLTLEDALRLADAFEGRGEPPITRKEVLAIGGHDKLFEVQPNKVLPPRYREQHEDVPVYGTALGTFPDGDDDAAIEQTYINYNDTVDHFVRPPKYQDHPSLYGFYVQGASMVPRFDDGDPAYADPKRPAMIGDDVVVYLVRPIGDVDDSWNEELDAVLVKTLIRKSATFIELRQYNPERTFRVDARRIRAIHRVLNRRDLSARM